MTYYLVVIYWSGFTGSKFLVESTCPRGAINQVLLNQEFLPADDSLSVRAIGLSQLFIGRNKLPYSLGTLE